MRKKAQPAYRNRNHTGWWIFREVEQWVSKRQKKLTSKSRCLVWENTRLIRAKSRDEAYRKALRVGRIGHPSKTKGGTWHFVGISLLLPLYEKIEDGVEILWTEHRNMPVARIKRLVCSKRQLPVFDDREDA
jgi:hypothetical protein